MAGYAVTITAVDRATATLDRINKSLERPLATASKFEQQIVRLSRNTGLASIADGAAQVGRSALDAARSLERIVAPLAGITGVASVAGVVIMGNEQTRSAAVAAAEKAIDRALAQKKCGSSRLGDQIDNSGSIASGLASRGKQCRRSRSRRMP